MELTALVEKLKKGAPKRVAIAAAHDDAVLKAAYEAYKLGIINPVLIGDSGKIGAISKANGIDISTFETIESGNDIKSAEMAVSLVREKKADMLMKGLLQTAELLRAVLDKEKGLRAGGILSHVAALNSRKLHKTWLLTDAAMVMYPDLKTKIQLIANAVAAAKGLGIEMPKVAPIAAVEVVNPDMPATVDASCLAIMNRRGQIKDCVIDGPLAFDIAVSEEAAKHKGIDSPAAGCADILLFHNIEAANSTLKAMTNIGDCLMGGVIMGAAAPIILTSRSDSDQSKLYSIAIAGRIAGAWTH